MSNKFGVHALLFSDEWNAEVAKESCELAAKVGFDLFEVLMFDPSTLDVSMTKAALRNTGLEARLGMALGPNTDLSSTDADVHRAGCNDVMRSLEVANELEAPAVSGITYAAFNPYQLNHNQEQYDQVVRAFENFDKRAGELGVKLGIEPVNRYESYMIQTLDQAAQLIADSGAKNCFVHMDTFHMNVEEGNVPAAIARVGDLLGYAHLADNHRGVLGTGSFDFNNFFRALAQADYSGDFTVESFSPAMFSAETAGAVSLWRSQWTSAEDAAGAALSFMKEHWSKAKIANGVW